MREGTTVTFEVTGQSREFGRINIGCKQFGTSEFLDTLRHGGGVATVSGTVKGTVDAHGRVVIAGERFTESEVREVANNLRIEEPPEPKREWQVGDVIARNSDGALRIRRAHDPRGHGRGEGWYDEGGAFQSHDSAVDSSDGFYTVLIRGGEIQGPARVAGPQPF